MLSSARFVIDPAFEVGAVDPRLYGAFIEHLGRCVYTGIYEPGHPTADDAGLRGDVLALIRELGVSVIRYPGGNFVSAYRWEDGVGPVENRPRRLDPAWRSIETNRFGLAEFMDFLSKVSGEPMLAVNLGTRGVPEAVDLIEYANHPGGTRLSDLRVEHGSPQPYAIGLWALGNEMDGPWQIGHKSSREYGRLAAGAAHAMRLVDPAAEFVVCGSSGRGMPTFGAWEAEVLEYAYDLADYVSVHAYYEEHDGDRDSFLASAADMDALIEGVVATCDYMGARLKKPKRMRLSFDEWNVWYMSKSESQQRQWAEAPRLLEDVYSVTDAVVFGSMLISLLRHADRVAIGCLAQLVNVIAPIMTQPGGSAWRQTTFFPFAQASRYGRGRVLQVHVDSPTYTTAQHGTSPLVYATAVLDDTSGEVAVFAVNRSQIEYLPLHIELRGLAATRLLEHSVLADADPDAKNTAAEPERVTPRGIEGGSIEGGGINGGTVRATLPPLSWNMIRIG